jgi:hypothetical protein
MDFFGRFSRRNLFSEEQKRNRNLQRFDSEYSLDIIDDSGHSDDDDDDDDDDTSSQYTTVTVETVKTTRNEPKNPIAAQSTQLFVGSKTASQDLDGARNDITKVSIYAKDVVVTKDVASNFLELVRGDNKSWEAMAVDILRQKARWNSIVLEDCSSPSSIRKEIDGKKDLGSNDGDEDSDMVDVMGGAKDETATYLDLLLSGIVNVDNCGYLHLTSLAWSLSTSFALQSLVFSKSLTKLQLDFIDLSEHVPALATSLSGNKSITCLIASRCGLLDDHLGILLGNLPRGIEELRVFGNKCRFKGLASLTDLLQKKSRYSLKILDLSFQHVEAHEEFDVHWFCEALGDNKTLKVLDLDNNSLDDGHLAHIVAALCRNKTIEDLSMNHNQITGMGVGMLAAKFGEMKGLKKISMYSNIFENATNDNATSEGTES